MPDSLLAVLSTAGWVVLVGVLLALFGRTEGGAWSIAGTVARGVRDWAGRQGPALEHGAAAARAESGAEPGTPDIEELADRPTR
jgi:hypothetical protein